MSTTNPRPPRGHRQKGAGTVISDRGPTSRTVGGIDIELKTWQKLPTTVLLEWTQKQKRPKPRYVNAKASWYETNQNVVRKRVILPDPRDSPSRDLSVVVKESQLKPESDDLAREEAAMIALFTIGPTLPLERVFPDPFRELWLVTQGEINVTEESASGKTLTAKEQREEKQREKEEKKRAQRELVNATKSAKGNTTNSEEPSLSEGATTVTEPDSSTNTVTKLSFQPLSRENWFTSSYEKEQYDLKKTKERNEKQNEREVKDDQKVAQYSQPLYFGQKMRAECLAALRAAGRLDLNKQGLSEEEVAEAASECSDNTVTGSDNSENSDSKFISHFCDKIGFDKEDVLFAVEACLKQSSNSTSVSLEMVQEWLTLNIPEECLPEKFQVKGQFNANKFTSDENQKTVNSASASLPSLEKQRQQQAADKITSILDQFFGFMRKALKNSDEAFDEATVDSLMCSVELFADQAVEGILGSLDLSVNQCDSSDKFPAPLLIEIDSELLDEALQGCQDILEAEGVSREGFLEGRFKEKWEEMVGELKIERERRIKENEEIMKKKEESNVTKEDDGDIMKESINESPPTRETYSSWFNSNRNPSFSSKPKNPPTVLPAQKVRAEFLKAVANHDVTLLVGQTGCGKSTQLPAFLMQENAGRNNVVCTQPRKLAALALARRVGQECKENSSSNSTSIGMNPGAPDCPVGFCVRGETAIGKNTSLVYCTVGVLLRKLLEGKIDFNYLVIDEAHERSLEIDFLLMLVAWHFKNQAKGEGPGKGHSKGSKSSSKGSNNPLPSFKLIVMSATLDQKIFDLFQNQSTNGTSFSSIRMDIEGRTFPVSLEYWTAKSSSSDGKLSHSSVCDAVQSVLNGDYDTSKSNNNMRYGKAILVFVPGVWDINKIKNILVQERGIHASKVLPLHSGMPSNEQKRCFEVLEGKVVISTNVCETSITIPDVTCVIDTCREKRLGLRETEGGSGSSSTQILRLTELTEQDCAPASLEQRKGRAGRVQQGLCVRMVSRDYFEKWIKGSSKCSDMEILPLENVVLQLLVYLGKSEGRFLEVLENAPSKPDKKAVDAGIQELVAVGAVTISSSNSISDSNNFNRSLSLRVTPLGLHLARLACDARLGKLLVYSAIFGVAGEGASLAAMLSTRNPVKRVPFNNNQSSSKKHSKELSGSEIERNRVSFRRSLLRPGGTKSDHCFLSGIVEHISSDPKISKGQNVTVNTSNSNPVTVTVNTIQFPRELRALCQSLHLSAESVHDALQLRKTFLQGLEGLGFRTASSDSNNNFAVFKWRWHLLRAACVAAFFTVKAKKPPPVFKKTGAGSIELPVDPKDVRYFFLETDKQRQESISAKRNNTVSNNNNTNTGPGRLFLPPDSVFFHEAPNGCYLTHSSLSLSNGQLRLEAASEAAPLAVLLLGSESFNLEFKSDGTIVVGEGKMVYTTAGFVRQARTWRSWRNSGCKGGGKDSSKDGSSSSNENVVFNPLISLLLKKLRNELQTDILRQKIENPGWDIGQSSVVSSIIKLLGTDGMG